MLKFQIIIVFSLKKLAHGVKSGFSRGSKKLLSPLVMAALAGWLYAFSTPAADAQDEAPSESIAVKWFKIQAERGDASAQCSLGVCYYGGYGVAKDEAMAMEWLRKAAEQGYAEAQCNVGVLYERKNDMAEAMKWYAKAAEQGYTDAQCNLGLCYAEINNFAEAVKWLSQAVARKNDRAQCSLGVCYLNGTWVKRNALEAVRLFRLAAERSNSTAEYNLGLCYINGSGVEPNEAEGVKWLNRSIEHGNELAKKAIKDLRAAKLQQVKLCRKTAEESDVNAQYSLALAYAAEDQLLPQNPPETLKWFRRAAERGHLKSQLYLAFCFDDNYSSFTDPSAQIDWKAEGMNSAVFEVLREAMRQAGGDCAKETAKWMSKAAEQGHKGAQYKLGRTFAAQQKTEESVAWYLKAAAQGHREAQFKLGGYYEERASEAVRQPEEHECVDPDGDMKTAAGWYLKAALQGHGESQAIMSRLYLYGEGVTQNLEEAKKWNLKAMAQNADSRSIQDLVEASPPTPPRPKINNNPTDAQTQYQLGLKYENGQTAEKWFLKAALQGHREAQFRLGVCYYGHAREDGVRQPNEAVKWYMKAAAGGHAEAAYNLGMIYEGNGNVTQSVKWYTKAAELGDLSAANWLGHYYSNFNAAKLGVKPNYAEALKWYQKAGNAADQSRVNYIQQLMAAQKK